MGCKLKTICVPHVGLTCSPAKASSRSNSSRAGGGGSRRTGRKVAGRRGGRGVSKAGGIRLKGAFFTPSCSYRATASGTCRMSAQ